MTVNKAYFILGLLIVPMLFGLLPIDMINGLILRENEGGSLSLGQIYKLPILLIMLLGLLMRPKVFFLSFSLIIILLTPTFLRVSFQSANYLKDFTNILKWMTPLISFYFFSELHKFDRLNTILRYWIYFSFVVMALNILTSLFGYGFPMYANALGTKIGTRGFFFAGNEVSVTLLVLYSFIAFQLRKSSFRFPFFVLNIFLAVLVSSKTGILGVFLIHLLIRKIGAKKKKADLLTYVRRLIAFIAIFLVVYYVSKIILTATPLGVRLTYFFNKLDFLTFVLSGRNLFFLDNLNILRSNYNFLSWIFGVGFSEYNFAFKKMVEIDILDIFFTFGFLGVLIFLVCVSICLKNISLSKIKSEKSIYSYYLFLVLILISSMTGHTFNSGMAGIFIGFCLAYYKLNGEHEA